MSGFLRIIAIAISVLVFALVLTVCGEAVACDGCVHACCVKSEQTDRRRDGIVSRIRKACSNLVSIVRPAAGFAVLASLEPASGLVTSPLLASKVAQLRV